MERIAGISILAGSVALNGCVHQPVCKQNEAVAAKEKPESHKRIAIHFLKDYHRYERNNLFREIHHADIDR
jgi:hypothetical protein